MSEPAAKRSFCAHKLVGAAAGVAVVAGGTSGVGVGGVITHVHEQATAGPDGLYGVTLTSDPAGKVSAKYIRDGTAAKTVPILAQLP